MTFYDGKSGAMREDSFNWSVADFLNGVLCMDLLENAVTKLH